MSPFLVFLLMCFSMHACKARYLGLFDKETKLEISKGGQKVVNFHGTSISSDMISPLSKEFEGEKRQECLGKIGRNLGAIPIQRKIAIHVVLSEGKGTKETFSGNYEDIISSQKDLQQTNNTEGLKRQERSVVESNDNEESVKSNENDIAEDVVVMDYAQPHRKPPIHNEKS